MTKLLGENHIDLLEFARGCERKQGDGKHVHALCTWEKTISDIYVFDGSVSYLSSNISESKSSMTSLEETPSSSPKLPLETSFLCAF